MLCTSIRRLLPQAPVPWCALRFENGAEERDTLFRERPLPGIGRPDGEQTHALQRGQLTEGRALAQVELLGDGGGPGRSNLRDQQKNLLLAVGQPRGRRRGERRFGGARFGRRRG